MMDWRAAARSEWPDRLEHAYTPNLDRCEEGNLVSASGGTGVTPAAAPAFGDVGYDPLEYVIGRACWNRGWLELNPSDVAPRGNFCTSTRTT